MKEIIEPRLFAGVVADEILASIEEVISDKGRCSIVLSGGKTPSTTYRLLAKPPRVDQIDWSKVDLFFIDERWVPRDDDLSNFRMVNETLLSHLSKSVPNVHSINVELATPEEGASQYSEEIKEYFNLSEGEMPSFDIALLGLGSEGHVASIFPNSEVFNRETEICYAVDCPFKDGLKRVTLSLEALFFSKRILFIVSGERKTEVIKKVLEEDGEVKEVPARYYKQAKGSVSWFLDSGAALKLS